MADYFGDGYFHPRYFPGSYFQGGAGLDQNAMYAALMGSTSLAAVLSQVGSQVGNLSASISGSGGTSATLDSGGVYYTNVVYWQPDTRAHALSAYASLLGDGALGAFVVGAAKRETLASGRSSVSAAVTATAHLAGVAGGASVVAATLDGMDFVTLDNEFWLLAA